ncbi:uncharacterized protein FA14DRAFT_30952 [Meira miltonrushii]|uniref:Uncharacterized protein n=1 Tax=Meira miltonrushii TaxID=1280837 RepID=A0A316VAI6_9BASI|nr:uncharacterized protein FA14DRAFT_30952 [Meira miltonrushii]PWN34492.1 hypothetical protein FA14DRAFT_30952 [Meira miltonrushii]
MPLCTLHLVQLYRQSEEEPIFAARRRFLHKLLSKSNGNDLNDRLLSACVVRRSVIMATRIDHVRLNKTAWDLVLVMKGSKDEKADQAQPLTLENHPLTKADIANEYTLPIGVPTRLAEGYKSRTEQLNAEAKRSEHLSIESLERKPARSVEQYPPKTSQNLEHSEDLAQLIEDLNKLGTSDGLADGRGPVQQLNFLAFNRSKEDKERYYQYGKGFTQAAKPFGGEPKILAKVVNAEEQQKWQEVSLVNYYSLSHFAGMAASEEYQEINRKYRLPSLDDTTIFCTQEVDLDGLRKRIQIPQSQANL